tara:strand:- start:12 stop:410 length:399 start_codon:yes stop_codon:yes gene_type:complete
MSFPFYRLPIDIQSLILGYLSIFELQYISFMIPRDLLRNTLNQCYHITDYKTIDGYINNFNKCCFLCSKNLVEIFNMIICKNCSLDLGRDRVYYPEICQKCSKIKQKRGIVTFAECTICKDYSTYLGISFFS